jgi:hypothetical protein
MLEPFSVAYGEIRGMLSAFASLSFKNSPDIHYTFDFQWLEKQKTAQATLEAYYANFAEKLSLSSLTAWRKTIQPTLETWLFDSLILPTFSEKYWFQIVQELVDKVEQLVQPTAAWQVDVQIKEKSFYELLWEDFALENEQAVFLLHLGFSD